MKYDFEHDMAMNARDLFNSSCRSKDMGEMRRAKIERAMSFGINRSLEYVEFMRICTIALNELCSCEDELKHLQNYGFDLANKIIRKSIGRKLIPLFKNYYKKRLEDENQKG